jgi:hypothetical protein
MSCLFISKTFANRSHARSSPESVQSAPTESGIQSCLSVVLPRVDSGRGFCCITCLAGFSEVPTWRTLSYTFIYTNSTPYSGGLFLLVLVSQQISFNTKFLSRASLWGRVNHFSQPSPFPWASARPGLPAPEVNYVIPHNKDGKHVTESAISKARQSRDSMRRRKTLSRPTQPEVKIQINLCTRYLSC